MHYAVDGEEHLPRNARPCSVQAAEEVIDANVDSVGVGPCGRLEGIVAHAFYRRAVHRAGDQCLASRAAQRQRGVFCARKDYVVTGALRPPWPTRVGRGYLIGANDLIRRCLDVSRLQELPFVRVVLLHARVGVGRAAANSTHNYFLNESGTLRVPLSLFVFSESDFLLIK